MKNIIKNLMEQFLTVLSLPCGYRAKSKLFLLLLLCLIVTSITYTSGIYQIIFSDKYLPVFIGIIIIYNFF